MRLILAGLVLALLLSCGEGFSSLDVIKRTSRSEFSMFLVPDYGRQGDRVVATATFSAKLNKLLLEAEVFFPTEITFGEGIQIEYFKSSTEVSLEVGLLISPLANTGERRPTLTFSLGRRLVTAQASFWILPSLPKE